MLRFTLISSVAAFALQIPGSVQAVVLTNGGFEFPEAVQPWLPTQFGDWAGDGGSIVQSEQGLVPAEGIRMLRFDFTHLGTAGDAISSDQWQLIDMSTLSQEIAEGRVTVSASAQFNRVVRNAQTDTEFQIGLGAFNGTPDMFDDPGTTPLTNNSSAILTDTNTASWEAASVTLALPPGTTYVGLSLSAVENIMNDLVFPEFHGLYADDVQFATNIDMTQPPSIVSATVHPAVLWPPNNKFSTVQVSAVVEGGAGDSVVKVFGVADDEDNDPADSRLSGGSSDTVELRATRSGSGDGRTYTLYLRAVDESGNESEPVSVQVKVPHDKRRR